MTTKEAAEKYLADHMIKWFGAGYHVYNPHNKPIEELPFIIGFNNGGATGFLNAIAISEDGFVLGGHLCSDEGYMPTDLGILEGSRPDRHENSYKKHYPNGYKMDFVDYDNIKSDERLTKAFELYDSRKNM